VPAGPGQPVSVLVVLRRAEVASVVPIFLGITVLALPMAVGIAVLVARATTRPLGELGAAASRVAGGDLNTTIEVRSRDELGLLATSFNTMTEELRRYVGALEDSRNELQAGVARIGPVYTPPDRRGRGGPPAPRAPAQRSTAPRASRGRS